jgi:phosphohistidine phosphatase
MEIYLVRHGIAEDLPPGGKDADRALTPEGKRKLREVLLLAKAVDMTPEVILTSPYVRARQTAEIAAQLLHHKSKPVECRALIPGGDPREVWEDIRTHKDARAVLLSSHEPLTGYLIAFLLSAPNLIVDVKKGSVTRIDVEQLGPQPRGVLKWILTPKMAAARP